MAKIYSDLHQNIQDRFNEAGMEIMSPHYAQVRDGNKMAIPDYLPFSPGTRRRRSVWSGSRGTRGKTVDAPGLPTAAGGSASRRRGRPPSPSS